MTFSIQAQNIFNRANLGTPVGNLSSSRFGQSLSTVGSFGPFGGGGPRQAGSNRTIELQVRFSF